MDTIYIGLLLVACLSALFVVLRYAAASKVKADVYTKTKSPLSPYESALLATLERTLPANYRIFSKLRISDIVAPSEELPQKKRLAALKHAGPHALTFTICAQPQLEVIAVVMCEDESGTDESIWVKNILADKGIPVVCFKAKPDYYVFEVWVKLSEGCPGIFEQPSSLTSSESERSTPERQISAATPDMSPAQEKHPASETASGPVAPVAPDPLPVAVPAPSPQVAAPLHAEPIPVRSYQQPCPACSGVLIRRQVVKGPHVGKFFLVCSNFPTCRHMVALSDDGDRPSEPAGIQQPLAATQPQVPTPSVARETQSPAALPAGVIASSPTGEALPPLPFKHPSVLPEEQIAIKESSAVSARPVSTIPAAVPSVEPQHVQICPACENSMVKMQVAKGAHAGKFFWACSDYPTCRQLVAIPGQG